MMQGIKDYVLAQTVSSVPTHKIYRSHLRTNPQQKFTVELIYFKSVHPSYRHLRVQGKKIEEPFLLLKEIFHNPSSRDQIVFVEAQRQGLQSLSSLYEGHVSFSRKLQLILKMIRLVPILSAYGLLHDFHPDRVMYDCEDNVFLGNFVKKATLKMGISTIEKNINDTIRTLLGKRVETEQLTDIRFQIQNEGVCLLKIENCSKDEDLQVNTTIAFGFSPERQALMYDYTINKQAAQDSLRRDISYEQLKQCGKWAFGLLTGGRRAVLSKKEQIILLSNKTDKKGGPDSDVPSEDTQLTEIKEAAVGPQASTEGQRSHPFNLVGEVISKMTNQDGKMAIFCGTGTLVSEYLVITCAHNLMKRVDRKHYKLLDVKNLTFKLGGKQYEVQSYRRPNQLYPKKQLQPDRKPQDYALIKLKEPIKMPKYIQIIKDYDKDVGKLLIEGKYLKGSDRMLAGTAFSKSFRFDQGYIKFQCDPASSPSAQPGTSQPTSSGNSMTGQVNALSAGFSGSPIILVAAETDNAVKYFFMVGIYIGRRNQDQLAVHFNDENIANFTLWEHEMTKESKIFKCIFSYNTVLSMDQDFASFKQILNKIQFNSDQIKYFPLIWEKVNPIFCASRQQAEEMYINAGLIRKDKPIISNQKQYKQQQKVNKILSDTGNLSQEQRYNNVVFMYSIHTYILWHVQWLTFPQDQGMYIVCNYITKRLCNFFQLALPCKDPTKATKFIAFREKLKNQLHLIYARHRQAYQRKAEILANLLKKMSEHIKHVPLNKNFKKFLQISQKFALNILTNHENNIKQLYYFPKLLMYTFIGKQLFGKLAILDKRIQGYLKPISSIISICLRHLQRKHPEDMEQVTHNFLWGVRNYMGEESVKQILRIVDQSLMSEEEKARQDAIDREVQMNYFSDWGWEGLERNYKILKKKGK